MDLPNLELPRQEPDLPQIPSMPQEDPTSLPTMAQPPHENTASTQVLATTEDIEPTLPAKPNADNPPFIPPYFAGATAEIPTSSPLYRNRSWKTWHLRMIARYWACITRVLDRMPVTKRKVCMLYFPFRMVMKFGTDIHLSEASTMRFLAGKTSIPVPKIYCAFEYNGMSVILMEFVRGKTLQFAWQEATPDVRGSLREQLRIFFVELRNIPHPHPGAICAVNGPLFDRRWDGDVRGFGPFANESDFNNFLRCGTTEASKLKSITVRFQFEMAPEEVRTMARIQDSKRHGVNFTHGDAHCGNFMVRNGRIVAVIDFEMAGFYPEYWEYTTAMTTGNTVGYDFTWWKEEFKGIVEEYPEEFQAELIRREYFNLTAREELPRAEDR